jgi:ABC-type phosphonate transport system ATPase subunit
MLERSKYRRRDSRPAASSGDQIGEKLTAIVARSLERFETRARAILERRSVNAKKTEDA